MTRCTRCNRQLTDFVSKARGFGPVCWQKHLAELEREWKREDRFHDQFIDTIPMDVVIVLHRARVSEHETVVRTNVPHLVTHHSPDGYEWGYGGSGPADLALNIVENLVREMQRQGFGGLVKCWDGNYVSGITWKMYQDFKRDFLCDADRDEHHITTDRARNWIRKRIREMSENRVAY